MLRSWSWDFSWDKWNTQTERFPLPPFTGSCISGVPIFCHLGFRCSCENHCVFLQRGDWHASWLLLRFEIKLLQEYGREIKMAWICTLGLPAPLALRRRCLAIRTHGPGTFRTEHGTSVHSSVGGRFRHAATPSKTQEWIKSGFREHAAMINCSARRDKFTVRTSFRLPREEGREQRESPYTDGQQAARVLFFLFCRGPIGVRVLHILGSS